MNLSKVSFPAPKPTNSHVYFDDDGNAATDAKSSDKTGSQDIPSGSGDAPSTAGGAKEPEISEAVSAVAGAQESSGSAKISETVNDVDDEEDEFLTADEFVDGDDVDVENDAFFDAGSQKPVFENAQVWIS